MSSVDGLRTTLATMAVVECLCTALDGVRKNDKTRNRCCKILPSYTTSTIKAYNAYVSFVKNKFSSNQFTKFHIADWKAFIVIAIYHMQTAFSVVVHMIQICIIYNVDTHPAAWSVVLSSPGFISIELKLTIFSSMLRNRQSLLSLSSRDYELLKHFMFASELSENENFTAEHKTRDVVENMWSREHTRILVKAVRCPLDQPWWTMPARFKLNEIQFSFK